MMACATPLASRMARAIVANKRTTRRMLTPLVPLHVPRWSVCTQGNTAVSLGLLLRRTPTDEVRHSPGPDGPGSPARKERGRPAGNRERRREDRPNAVTLITLRLRRQLHICQVAIINYARQPFLSRERPEPRTTSARARLGR